MAWRTAYSLDTLLDEINQLYPDRDKRTDGAISGYPGATSSHNVNSDGVVCARDITTGDYPGGISPSDGIALAEQIRLALKVQPRGNPAYIIHHMEPPYVPYAGPWIAHGISDWEWYAYAGTDPHTSHIHVSVDWDILTGGAPSGEADYDTKLAWGLTQNDTSQVSVDTSEEIDVAAKEEILEAIAGLRARVDETFTWTNDRIAETKKLVEQSRNDLAGWTRDDANAVRGTISAAASVNGAVDVDKLAAALKDNLAADVAKELGRKLASDG